MAFCHMLPRPRSAAIGDLRRLLKRAGRRDDRGLMFILPGAVVMIGLSHLYVVCNLRPVKDMLFILKPACWASIAAGIINSARRL